jgi:hypothetical protein
MDLLQCFQDFWWRKGGQGTTGHGCEGVEARGESIQQAQRAMMNVLNVPESDVWAYHQYL